MPRTPHSTLLPSPGCFALMPTMATEMADTANDDGTKEKTAVIYEKHPTWVRLTHWINFPVLLIMLWSGILIYWANRAYWPNLPDGFYQTLGFEGRLAEGMAYHFTFMWIFAINGLIYVVFLLSSGEWRELCPRRKSFREAIHVVLHDLGISKRPLPPGKLNAAQRFAYTGALLMGAGAVTSGIAIYKPVQLSWLKQLLGGYEWARLIHYVIAVGFVLFFIVHILQVVRAGWNNFRAMVAGYDLR